MNEKPRCIPLAQARGALAGGKAEGLARLLALGLPVPDGFVILHATQEALPEDLEAAYDRMGRGRVAVRSSASDEDGEAASFAGQHETVLDVEGIDALREAIVRCLRSLESEHARAYRASRTTGTEAAMSLVVQRMVDARCAGVLFSADPVTARRDRMVVDAVEGLGDVLVSGLATPDHFLLARDGSALVVEPNGPAPCVSREELAELAAGALRIEHHFERPVDCEWAIDRDGRLAWLQARPITTLPGDPRELDTPPEPGHVYTKCNIGEMMPGAVTPLTWSTSVRGIDHGMQRMYVAIGASPAIDDRPRFVGMWFGHLFLDLSRLAGIAGSVAGASEADAVTAICGRPVPEIVPGPRLAGWERARNGIAYARIVLASQRHVDALRALVEGLELEPGGDAAATFAAIDREMPKLMEAYFLHLAASTLAGALAGALLQVLASGKSPSEEHHAEVASLLAGAEGVESHDIAAGIDRIVRSLLAEDGPALDRLVGMDPNSAAVFLRHEASVASRTAFRAYLERHGHRCVREVELREKEWDADPAPIVEAVLSGVRAARTGRRRPNPPNRREVPLRMKPVVALAHRGVRAREAAKSFLVKATARFKRAYRSLARQMVHEGLLADEDAVYFLEHLELGRLVRDRNSALSERALARREVLPIQMKLGFPEIFLGRPEPVPPPVANGEGVLRGKPVSRGSVRGRARVARTLEEAWAVQPGEILIAPITDVGWTPCFATIAGLATDIGSAVSHGAVVAREYGLPALVDLRTATATFRTGELVELDADAGVLRRIDE